MKKILLFTFIFLFNFELAKSLPYDFCVTMSELGESTIIARDNGISLSTAINETSAVVREYNLEPSSADLLYTIVTVAYETNLSASAYADAVFEVCVAN